MWIRPGLESSSPWCSVSPSFYGTRGLELLPLSIIGGVLFFIGGDLLNTWLIQARKRLHGSDYAIIVLISVAIAVFGFIEGVGVGMLATLTLFAFRLSKEKVIAEERTAGQLGSTRVRSVPRHRAAENNLSTDQR